LYQYIRKKQLIILTGSGKGEDGGWGYGREELCDRAGHGGWQRCGGWCRGCRGYAWRRLSDYCAILPACGCDTVTKPIGGVVDGRPIWVEFTVDETSASCGETLFVLDSFSVSDLSQIGKIM